MYITNTPYVAEIADRNGVDRIFVDLETVGKALRQPNMNTVISDHSIEDIGKVKAVVKKAEILVRVNQIYHGSEKELNTVAESDADIIMLPYFKTADAVRKFVSIVDGRKKCCALIETPEAVACIDEILAVDGIDEVFIGLNDLHIGYGNKFMFVLLANGTVDRLCEKFKKKGVPYGFGGVARPDFGTLKGKYILGEHYRLGSECVILSRSFCNCGVVESNGEIEAIMRYGVKEIREYEKFLESADEQFFQNNRRELIDCVDSIIATR